MQFEIGDQVVHPQHGVGQVVKLEDKEFESGVIRRYYEISMKGGSTIWVPVDLGTVGLRKPAGRSEIARCRKILTSRPAPLPGPRHGGHGQKEGEFGGCRPVEAGEQPPDDRRART